MGGFLFLSYDSILLIVDIVLYIFRLYRRVQLKENTDQNIPKIVSLLDDVYTVQS